MKKIFLFIFCSLVFFSFSNTAFASDADEVTAILDKWTSAHWGDDCFVWIVHYPEELAVPWAELEVRKGSINAEQKDSYAESFMKELSMDKYEPFLVSVTFFSDSNVDLSPFENRISLISRKGEKIRPVSFDGAFEQPANDSIRGLVFFPKQEEGVLRVQLNGLGLGGDGIFSFGSSDAGSDHVKAQPDRKDIGTREGVIVIRPSSGIENDKDIPQESDPEPADEPENAVLKEAETGSSSVSSDENSEKGSPEMANRAFKSRDLLLRTFLDSWISGDYKKMYSLLSTESRKKTSEAAFTGDSMQSPFRIILMNGYTYDWENEDTAVVTSKSKLEIMKGISTKKIRLAEEGNGWKILW